MTGQRKCGGSGVEEIWRGLPFDRGSTAEHFARSDALVRLVTIPSLWWHATETSTLILGAGQRLTWEVENQCLELDVEVVRRQSGGTAVFADPDVLGLDVALPPHHRLVGTDVVENYRWLGEVWVGALRSLGIAARLVEVEDARQARKPRPQVASALRAACFGTLSPFEVIVGGKKLVGLAQVRRRTGVLLQSVIHLHFDRDQLAALLQPLEHTNLADELREVSAAVDELLPTGLYAEDITPQFARQLKADQHVSLRDGSWTPEEESHAASFVHS
jgi:lipoate-protein ligase A